MTDQDHNDGGGRRRPPEPRVIALQELLGCDRDVVLAYGDRRYRLRITRQDKVILTKDERAPTADDDPPCSRHTSDEGDRACRAN